MVEISDLTRNDISEKLRITCLTCGDYAASQRETKGQNKKILSKNCEKDKNHQIS
jgi:formylmethanofuran dehydrogenase subunit E